MEAHPSGELAMLARRPIRILVIDNNLQEQQLFKLKLEALGTSVIQVQHGRMAIMAAQKTLPDIIILDLETPDMAGLEVLRHLKSVKKTSGIPVICISGSQNEEHRMRALRMHADWYLDKPFRFSEMLARLRHHAQEIATRDPSASKMSFDELRRNILHTSVDTMSDIQDIRKALHSLKGYVGADDYYLNSKLEICFRNLMRIESRLKEFRELKHHRPRPGARIARSTKIWPLEIRQMEPSEIFPLATEEPDFEIEDDE